MILIGNGPSPFGLTVASRPNLNAPEASNRPASVRNGATPGETIPAAAAQRSGVDNSIELARTGNAGMRAVLATSKTEATQTNPEDRYRAAGQTTDYSEAIPEYLQRRSPPPPLTSYASIPTELMVKIRQINTEISELRTELVAKEEEAKQAKAESTKQAAAAEAAEADVAPATTAAAQEAPVEPVATVQSDTATSERS